MLLNVAHLFLLASPPPSPLTRYFGSFYHGPHLCMVFERLGASLYDYMKLNRYKPFPLYCVQSFADQLVNAIAFLHQVCRGGGAVLYGSMSTRTPFSFASFSVLPHSSMLPFSRWLSLHSCKLLR